jgi:hypothetical protein
VTDFKKCAEVDEPGSPAYSYVTISISHLPAGQPAARRTCVSLSIRPDVPRYGSSRVSDNQVCVRDDFVDGLASSRILRGLAPARLQ